MRLIVATSSVSEVRNEKSPPAINFAGVGTLERRDKHMLKDWQIAVIISTIGTFMATCAGGIVPGDRCTGIDPYIDWVRLGQFVLSPLGVPLVLGSWIFLFGLVYLLGRSRNRCAQQPEKCITKMKGIVMSDIQEDERFDFFGILLVRDVPDRDGVMPIDDVGDHYLGFLKTEKEAGDYVKGLLNDGWIRPDGLPLTEEDIIVEPIPFGQHVPLVSEGF